MSKEFQNLDNYLEAHTSEEDIVLRDLYRETHLKTIYPRMVSGHMQGKLLEFISKMIKPEFILEIGTFTGYSAICLARGLKPEGHLHTIEMNDELKDFAGKYFVRSGLADKITQHIGNALEIIPALKMEFDIVFIDAEKTEYQNYYKMVKPLVKKGGIILADNVLWGNKVLEHPDKFDKETRAIDQFNKIVQNDPEVENLILPLRDGLTLARKL